MNNDVLVERSPAVEGGRRSRPEARALPDPVDAPAGPERRPPPLPISPRRPVKMVHVTTDPAALKLQRGFVGHFMARGFRVWAVSSPSAALEDLVRDEGVQGIPIEMGRRLTPGSDVKALAQLWWTFRKIRPAIVHGHSPRGGLLAMIAAFLAGVPVRVCTVPGRPLETASGWKRMWLRWTERVSRLLANRVVSTADESRAAIEREYRDGLERRSGARAEAAPEAGSAGREAGPSRSAEKGLKRIFDISIALSALVLAAPVMGLIALGTWVTLGSPIFFRQFRPGLKGRPFVPLKFRTMRAGPEKDAQRMTTLGRLLRQFSLDELPQLWTVVRGDMSLVGPRPLLMSYLKRYTPRLLKRQDMKPGITGWCQVNGRNNVSWDRKFELDLWYVEHWSVLLDFKILFMTMRRVIRKPGDEGPGHHVWPESPGPSAPPVEKTP